MNNNLENKDWDSIVKDAYKQDAEKHQFSSGYQNRKRMMRKQLKKSSVRSGRIVMAAAAAAVVVVLVPGGIYATAQIQKMYANTAQVGNTDSIEVVVNREQNAERVIVPMEIVAGYVPEGMTQDTQGAPKYSYDTNRNKGGFSLQLWKLGSEETEFTFPVNNAESSDPMKVNGRDAILVTKEADLTFNKIVFINFEEEGYVLQCYVGSDVPAEEMQKFIEAVSLQECDAEQSCGKWRDYVAGQQASVNPEMAETKRASYVSNAKFTAEEAGGMYAVGESFIEGTKVWSPYYNTIGITVNSVQVQKDFTGVTTDSIGREMDFSEYLEEDGKLADGVSVVVVDMTYQNVGQDYIEWDRVCVCPDLYYLHNEDGVYQCYSKMAGFRNTRYHDLAYDAGMFSFATDEDKGYKNGLGDLQPGQKRPAQVAFLVKDENLANMYLTINAYGNSDSVGYTFDQYVYIGQ